MPPPPPPELPAIQAVLPLASTVSIPPLPTTTTVAPTRATAGQNQSHKLPQVKGFRINSDGNYQCKHLGCKTIMNHTVLKDSLRRHQKTHEEIYQCSKCGYRSRAENIRRHIKRKGTKCSDAVLEKVILKESNVQVVTDFTKTPNATFSPPSLTSSTLDQTEGTHQTTALTSPTPLPFQMPPPFLPTSPSAIAPLPDQAQEQEFDLDDAFIAALLREEQTQQASTDDQSQQQQRFTVGSCTAANLLPSQITPPQTFFGQQPFTVDSSVGDRIRERLRQIEIFIRSYTYQNTPAHLKQRALADFTASLDGSMVPATQTIGSATPNVSAVNLATVSTVAALAQKKFQCDLCEKSFASRDSLGLHLKNDHAHQLRLPSERSSIKLSAKLKKYFTQEDSKIICKECNEQFASTRNVQVLYKHIYKHLKKYKCSLCNKIYCDSSSVTKHIKKSVECKNAKIRVVDLTSTAPSASNQQEFSDDDDDE